MKKAILPFILSLLFILCACSTPKTLPEKTPEPSADPAGSEPAAESSLPVSEEEPVTEETQTVYPVTVTDLDGVETTIEAAARIVSLTPSNTEILVSAGALDRIIGVDTYSAEIAPDAETVGDYTNPDVERIVALEPDIILAGNNMQFTALEQMRQLGLPVISSEATTWDEVDQSFRLIGEAVNENDAAEALVTQLLGTVADVEEQAPAPPISCYYVMSYGDAGNWTCGEGSFIQQMMEYAGGDPVIKNTDSPWIEYSLENLTVADPACIILSSEAGTYEDFITTPGYENLSAVKNGMVFTISADSVTRPGPGLNEGLLALSGIFLTAAEGPVRPMQENAADTPETA